MLEDNSLVTLSHGSGGRAMHDLIDEVFLARFGTEDRPTQTDDSALLSVPAGLVAFTTDSFVVDPIVFPGGDIGRIAVAGTVNDLLTAAARPVAISAAFIIEEGLPVGTLRTIAQSMAETALEAGVSVVTGDTKVVPRGSADKLYITTSGIGVVTRPGIGGSNARPGDKIILTGSIGDHGAAVMLAREKLLDSVLVESDCAPLTDIVMNLLEAGCELHAMRDPTRGGLAATLNEIASQSQVSITINEDSIYIKPPVNAVCEALGIEPLYVANEGKMVVVVASEDAPKALEIVRRSKYGEDAREIGEVRATPPGRVQMRTSIGTTRIVTAPYGELLPRIC